MSGLRDDQRRFIDQFACLLAPWGMPMSSGRVNAYLLLNAAPVSVNRIAADLKMSKVSAWKAARSLAEFGHVRRYGEPGSKRALYGPSEDFASPFRKQSSLLGALGTCFQESAATIGSPETSVLLQEMAKFYFSLQQAMERGVGEASQKPIV
jgi:hypothetical protein